MENKTKKSLLKTTEWKIYNLFRDNAINGVQIRLSQTDLSEMFNVKARAVRSYINNIIIKTDLALIGDDEGYRVAMNKEEHEQYQRLLFARLKTSIDKFLSASGGNQAPIYNYLNTHKGSQNRPLSNQLRMKITDNTTEIVRKNIEDYKSL